METQIDRARQLFPGKVFAFVAITASTPAIPNPFGLGVAVLGEAGYSPAPYREGFDSYAEANDRADALNRELGYEWETAIAIVADTMSRSNFKREQEQGLTAVKLTQREIKDLMGAIPDTLGDRGDDIMDKLESALD